MRFNNITKGTYQYILVLQQQAVHIGKNQYCFLVNSSYMLLFMSCGSFENNLYPSFHHDWGNSALNYSRDTWETSWAGISDLQCVLRSLNLLLQSQCRHRRRRQKAMNARSKECPLHRSLTQTQKSTALSLLSLYYAEDLAESLRSRPWLFKLRRLWAI